MTFALLPDALDPGPLVLLVDPALELCVLDEVPRAALIPVLQMIGGQS